MNAVEGQLEVYLVGELLFADVRRVEAVDVFEGGLGDLVGFEHIGRLGVRLSVRDGHDELVGLRVVGEVLDDERGALLVESEDLLARDGHLRDGVRQLLVGVALDGRDEHGSDGLRGDFLLSIVLHGHDGQFVDVVGLEEVGGEVERVAVSLEGGRDGGGEGREELVLCGGELVFGDLVLLLALSEEVKFFEFDGVDELVVRQGVFDVELGALVDVLCCESAQSLWETGFEVHTGLELGLIGGGRVSGLGDGGDAGELVGLLVELGGESERALAHALVAVRVEDEPGNAALAQRQAGQALERDGLFGGQVDRRVGLERQFHGGVEGTEGVLSDGERLSALLERGDGRVGLERRLLVDVGVAERVEETLVVGPVGLDGRQRSGVAGVLALAVREQLAGLAAQTLVEVGARGAPDGALVAGVLLLNEERALAAPFTDLAGTGGAEFGAEVVGGGAVLVVVDDVAGARDAIAVRVLAETGFTVGFLGLIAPLGLVGVPDKALNAFADSGRVASAHVRTVAGVGVGVADEGTVALDGSLQAASVLEVEAGSALGAGDGEFGGVITLDAVFRTGDAGAFRVLV